MHTSTQIQYFNRSVVFFKLNYNGSSMGTMVRAEKDVASSGLQWPVIHFCAKLVFALFNCPDFSPRLVPYIVVLSINYYCL